MVKGEGCLFQNENSYVKFQRTTNYYDLIFSIICSRNTSYFCLIVCILVTHTFQYCYT